MRDDTHNAGCRASTSEHQNSLWQPFSPVRLEHWKPVHVRLDWCCLRQCERSAPSDHCVSHHAASRPALLSQTNAMQRRSCPCGLGTSEVRAYQGTQHAWDQRKCRHAVCRLKRPCMHALQGNGTPCRLCKGSNMGTESHGAMSRMPCWVSSIVGSGKAYTLMMKVARHMQVFERRGADWDLA